MRRIIDKRADGFYGSLFEADKNDKRILIIIGGSEGSVDFTRDLAYKFYNSGYNAFSFNYFNMPGLPSSYKEIPIESIENAIKYLNDLGYEKIGLYGFSMGAELSLLTASMFPDKISAVIAVSPTDTISQGYVYSRKPIKLGIHNTSAWSYNKKPLPYSKFKKDFVGLGLNILATQNYSLLPLMKSRENERDEKNLIKVEKITAPILLISSTKDSIWNSSKAADRIQKRLKRNNFKYPFENIKFNNANHFLTPIYIDLNIVFKNERVNPDGANNDRAKSFKRTLKFLENNFN